MIVRDTQTEYFDHMGMIDTGNDFVFLEKAVEELLPAGIRYVPEDFVSQLPTGVRILSQINRGQLAGMEPDDK